MLIVYCALPAGRSGCSGKPSAIWALNVPRLVPGSTGALENSRKRSELSSSTAAGTGPSIRKRTLAGGAGPWVSGTSKTPLVIASLRLGASSILPRPTCTVAVRPEMRTFMSASRIGGKPSIGRISAPLPVISIPNPLSGIGGPLDRSVDSCALVAIEMRSTVPLTRCSSTQWRTLGAMNAGHSRFIAVTDMRLPAMPISRRGSPLARSMWPEARSPISVLPNSPCSMSMRCFSGSSRMRSRKRLRTMGLGSLVAAASTTVPPVIFMPHDPPASRGASSCANSVIRLPPATIWNGTIKACRIASQSSENSARSMVILLSGSSRSTMEPRSMRMRPSTMCGMPSGPMSARILAETGRSGSN